MGENDVTLWRFYSPSWRDITSFTCLDMDTETMWITSVAARSLYPTGAVILNLAVLSVLFVISQSCTLDKVKTA